MRPSYHTALAAAAAGKIRAATLADICTVENVQAALPANQTIPGIAPLPATVAATPVYNATSSGSTFSYCNVSVAYTHIGKNDQVNLWYWFPAPDDFKNRFLAVGGEGYSISLGQQSLPSGVVYGAVTGTTDGGFDGFNQDFDAAFLLANGTIDYDVLYMFGYQALGEMSVLGKAITKGFYTTDQVYTYFSGCSDGGREAWSQVQKWGSVYDGVIAGAPALRYGQQQVNHLTSDVTEQTLGYYPPSCELDKIVNLTIAACDGLDGKVDGLVSRSDLCKLNFNINSTVGEPYYCAESTQTSLGLGYGQKMKRQMMGGGASFTPEQNGTVSAQGAALVQKLWDGLQDTQGRQAYVGWQPAASFADAQTTYDNDTQTWGLDVSSGGGEWVARFLELTSASTLASLDNVTYDTLIGWMTEGMTRYSDVLQTTIPDLTPFQSTGGKVLHYHGEADDSIPAASSVRYYNSVRDTMYPGQSYNSSVESMNDWYRLFLVPGAAHCSTNTLMPDGPYPDTLFGTIIEWVENGAVPATLNGTLQGGADEGEIQSICSFPLRPYWSDNTTVSPDCVYDQASIDSWSYDLTAFSTVVY